MSCPTVCTAFAVLRRISFVRVLADFFPPFIIADEPTTDLDVVSQARILDLLESIMRSRAPGMLLVTHDMGVVARLADDVAVMDNGKIVELGDVETLFRTPQHSVTRNLVSAHLALYGMELAS